MKRNVCRLAVKKAANALVDSIMTALDGTMDLKSTLGRGTVVTLGLPMQEKIVRHIYLVR